jgi:hypothetical protein
MHRAPVLLISLAVLSGCSTEPGGTAIFGPDTVTSASVPALAASVYQRPTVDTPADSLLDVLLRRQIDVLDLWAPIGGTPCMAACATANIIVALQAPDDRMRQYGFDTTAGWMCINCGIDRFIHYRVVR